MPVAEPGMKPRCPVTQSSVLSPLSHGPGALGQKAQSLFHLLRVSVALDALLYPAQIPEKVIDTKDGWVLNLRCNSLFRVR